MNVEFEGRGDGWRHRGRPPRVVPPDVMNVLQQTYETQQQAKFPVDGASAKEVRQLASLLELGASKIGKKLRWQADELWLRFYVEDEEEAA